MAHNETQTKILIVEDEPDICDLIRYNLEKEDYSVITAGNGEDAIQMVKTESPDLVLLDIMMPKLDGIETCRRIRALPEGKNVYILFLTARSEEYSEIAGFEAGADDYISKPIKPRVLLSRISAVLRRQTVIDEESQKTKQLKIHDLRIIRDEFLVYKGDEPLTLPKKEFELIYFLASNPGKVFSRDKLLQKIWGTDVLVVDRTVDVHIRKLREKIGKNYIQTIKGVGYKFLP